MVFTTTTLSFFFFATVFFVVSSVASVFIVPLLVLSFVFSGFVIIFSGLSYTTFKIASAKYNRTVLFLNRLLRKLADNIPPSVGYIEVPQTSKFKLPFMPSLGVRSSISSGWKYLTDLLSKSTTEAVLCDSEVLENKEGFETTLIQGSNGPLVVVDEDGDSVIDQYFQNKPAQPEKEVEPEGVPAHSRDQLSHEIKE